MTWRPGFKENATATLVFLVLLYGGLYASLNIAEGSGLDFWNYDQTTGANTDDGRERLVKLGTGAATILALLWFLSFARKRAIAHEEIMRRSPF